MIPLLHLCHTIPLVPGSCYTNVAGLCTQLPACTYTCNVVCSPQIKPLSPDGMHPLCRTQRAIYPRAVTVCIPMAMINQVHQRVHACLADRSFILSG